MIKLFDTHAHLLDERFDTNREQMINEFAQNDVAYVIECGTSEEDSKKAVALGEKYDNIYVAVGVHPEYASTYTQNTSEALKTLAQSKKVVAIGEAGLDYHYDETKKEVQKKAFISQLIVAKELNLPIAIHSRDSAQDTLDILKEHKDGLKGVMHCFSGSYEVAKQVLDLGLYIAIGGVVTFKNAKKTVEVIEKMDLSKLILETDCPYLAPEPFRGKLNMPAYVKYTAQKIGEIRGLTLEEIAEITFNNSTKLFNIQ